MAATLKAELNVPDVELIPGGRGEFTVWVGERKVAAKGWSGFPEEDEVVERVRAALPPA